MPAYRIPGLPEDEPPVVGVLPWVETFPPALGSSRRGHRGATTPGKGPGG